MLKIHKNTVARAIKKENNLVNVHPNTKKLSFNRGMNVVNSFEDAELDEQWSFVSKKENQRGLWFAIDPITGSVLTYVFGKKKTVSSNDFIQMIGAHINVTLTLKRILSVKQRLKK